MDLTIDELIQQAQSSDNVSRENAETQLLKACDADASQIFNALVNVALNEVNQLTARQFALLSLRKLITFYWGPGFDSYRNTSVVSQEMKNFLRESLIKLCLNENNDKKIRNGASYCVVQISAVDFPDQWPQLLEIVYDAIANRNSLTAISLLNEIYDDVISEEMFFEGGIGYETLSIIFKLLINSESTLDAKIAATKLFNAALLQMSGIDSHSTQKRKLFIQECIPRSLETLGNLLTYLSNLSNSQEIELVGKIYENLILIKNEFPKNLFPTELKESFKLQIFKDLDNLKKEYSLSVQPTSEEDKLELINQCGIYIIEFLSSMLDSPFTQEEQLILADSFIILCNFDSVTLESYTNDFNDFVSKETGLMASFSIRDQVNEFLTSLDGDQLNIYFQLICHRIMATLNNYDDNTQSGNLESSLYLLQSLLLNEEDISMNQADELLLLLNTVLVLSTNNPLLKGRIFLLVPKVLDKFIDSLPDVRVLVRTFCTKIVDLCLNIDDDLIRSCTLISFTYFTYFAELPSVLGNELCSSVQKNILQIITELLRDAEEDTYGLLIEVVNQVISTNSETTPETTLKNEFSLVLTISGKDPSNIQIVVESQECLEKLLEGINTDTYKSYIQMCLPSFIHMIDGNRATSYKYSPLLSLILEFLTVFMKKKPNDGLLPSEISDYIFEPLVNVLKESSEDETLQLATDAFSYLIYNTDPTVMVSKLDTVVNVLDTLLSINVSDTAAMNVGTLIVTIFTKFSNEIQSLIPVILRAAVERLIQSKNISTQQNLISLLCFLTCSDVNQTVKLLFQLQDEQQDPNLVQKLLIKWFESFEVIRGERKIKENIVALSKLYSLGDPRIAAIVVNGDLIPYEGDLIITRSMAKKMPNKYTQISPYTKIVKLFVAELGFQTKQPDVHEHVPTNTLKEHVAASAEDDDGGWEDVDDVLEYDKLKEYIDDDDEDPAEYGEDDAQEISGLGDIQHSVTELLIESLKHFATSDANLFGAIYNTLTEQEKATLTERLL